MSNNKERQDQISRSSGARGRIAQVLAQARASLKEPSRPITPLHFDQTNSLTINYSSKTPASLGKQKINKVKKPNTSEYSYDILQIDHASDQSDYAYPSKNFFDLQRQEEMLQENKTDITDFPIKNKASYLNGALDSLRSLEADLLSDDATCTSQLMNKLNNHVQEPIDNLTREIKIDQSYLFHGNFHFRFLYTIMINV